jgi:hypothetical protein
MHYKLCSEIMGGAQALLPMEVYAYDSKSIATASMAIMNNYLFCWLILQKLSSLLKTAKLLSNVILALH